MRHLFSHAGAEIPAVQMHDDLLHRRAGLGGGRGWRDSRRGGGSGFGSFAQRVDLFRLQADDLDIIDDGFLERIERIGPEKTVGGELGERRKLLLDFSGQFPAGFHLLDGFFHAFPFAFEVGKFRPDNGGFEENRQPPEQHQKHHEAAHPDGAFDGISAPHFFGGLVLGK